MEEIELPRRCFDLRKEDVQVRHAQGVHNVEGEKDPSAYTSPAFFDAPITPLGWRQVDYLREHVKNCGLAEKIELVICSPLLRTMQTAVGVFGGESYTGGGGAPPLMVENAGQSERLAISSLNCPPFLAVETCRERLIENDEDVLWVPDVTEAHKSFAARGMKFMDCVIESGSPSLNYPGNIPVRLDLPSDVTDN
ncbi:hypothetical protein C2845_PM15G00160 [Panicum miliaceum]|uniref:Uncharacterized protein n=1 Tax=Panicum miliaceum TaxID=4540 RepID=A0A3L6QCD4_PANMI|nr:hypothetical protein C2845_PM15G00160 [Panicum miliaceum]